MDGSRLWRKRSRIEQANSRSEDLLEQARQERLSILSSCESIIVRMALDMLKKIVEKELTANSDTITKRSQHY